MGGSTLGSLVGSHSHKVTKSPKSSICLFQNPAREPPDPILELQARARTGRTYLVRGLRDSVRKLPDTCREHPALVR